MEKDFEVKESQIETGFCGFIIHFCAFFISHDYFDTDHFIPSTEFGPI